MPVEELLTALDPLPYHERMRHLAAWARTAPDRAEVCAELVTRGDYGRRLALVAAMVAQDAAGLKAAAIGPQPLLRAGLFDRRISDLSARDRRRAYRTLRRLDDPATADALIAEVRAHFGDQEAAALLPACGPSLVRELLPDLEFAVDLEALGRRHPQLLLARAGERLAAVPLTGRRAVWDRIGPAVLSCDPARALDLVEQFPVDDYLPGSSTAYGRLAAVDPGRVARLLTSVETFSLPPAVTRRLAKLPTDALVPLARRHLAELLDALPPSRRGDLYDRVAESAGRPSRRVLELLPAAVRIREAARMQPPEAGRAYLAWPDASAALAADLRSADADERLRAWRQLILAARLTRDPRAVPELIDRLDRVANEQDPVRVAVLTALTGVVRRLTATAAPALTKATTAAVEARDASPATFAALSDLAAETLRRHADEPDLREWALSTIDRVSRVTAHPYLPRLDGSEALVFDRLRDWVAASAAAGRHEPLLALTHALGPRAADLPGLQEMLRAAITSPRAGAQAVTLWLADRRHRSQRVAEVLDLDPAAVRIPIVWATLGSSRTDLLDRVLADPPSVAGERWIPGPPSHLERWLPRQHTAFAALLSAVVDDASLPVRVRADALRTAAAIPGAGRDLVLRHRDDADVVLAEAALGALPWTDRPDEALSILLEYAGTDRARVALPAAGRAARHTTPNRLPALLGGVLTGPAKVTSRKEAARLLARYASAEVMTLLLEVFETPDTPRDVRTAIVSGAARHLETDAAWAILTAADGVERRPLLGAVPGRISSRHRPRYARLVADACRSHNRPDRLAAFAALPRWLPWVDAADVVTARFTDLGEELAPHAVAGLIPALLPTGLTAVLADLVERDADPELVRRRLEVLEGGAAAWSRSVPAAVDRSALIASARWLAARPPHLAVAAMLLLGLSRLHDLDELADLCAARPVLAVRLADRIRDRLPHDDDATVRRLAARRDLAGGLFAVALLSEARPHQSDLLLSLRAHPEPEVRDEAYAIALPRA